MSDSLLGKDQVDGVLLGWCFTWSIVLSIALAGFAGLGDPDSMEDESQFLFASSLGGLAATWTAMGVWAALIDVKTEANAKRPMRRWQTVVGCFLLVNAVVMVFALQFMPSFVAFLLLLASISSLGPFLIWQWFRRPIHRGPTPPTGQRSIGQILGMAVTIAVGNVLFKVAGIWMDLSEATIMLVLCLAVGWTLLLLTMLGRQWGWIFGLIPLCIGQPFAVLLVMDMESSNADEQAMIVSGTCIGFYLFAMLYVLLLRSSGHKWFRSI
ncbi:hypothetical protein [Rhodopirellula sp. P2]|uniref:hypothetical protein n=1 Tax=Rhodopirellula sp. P2 TaxID=2127060 RepID=UPI0023682A61|nr:hypothetical protein [Rhodopirellula sp. P2]WDQ16354.1 hypothetical protein PSR62_22415 [Rhodopirellula sp. P2]